MSRSRTLVVALVAAAVVVVAAAAVDVDIPVHHVPQGHAVLPGEGMMAPQQLNTTWFARCMLQQSQDLVPDRAAQIAAYKMNWYDLLLLHLAFYAGDRRQYIAPFQQFAWQRWSQPFWPAEAAVAAQMDRWARQGAQAGRDDGFINPGMLWRAALAACDEAGPTQASQHGRDWFCAALTLHNTLRTLGRWRKNIGPDGTDYNPSWLKERQTYWVEEGIPRLQRALMPLRVDHKGDRWGEMYHSFGVAANSLHNAYLLPDRQLARNLAHMIVRLQTVVAPVTPEKWRVDDDTVVVFDRMLYQDVPHRSIPTGTCDQRVSFVFAHVGDCC